MKRVEHPRFAHLVGFASILAVVGCGGDDSPTSLTGAGSISARLDGVAWSVGAPYTHAQVVSSAASVHIFAADPGASHGLAITLAEVTGPGTYTLHDTFPLRFAVVNRGTDPGWGSTYGGSGSVTIATMSDARITGTFAFTAGPGPNSSETGMLVVTNGQFDLPVVVP